jgi:RHS repeat-associated protein
MAGASQGREFPHSVGVYVWAEALSAGAGTVSLSAQSEIVLKLQEGETRQTNLTLSGTAAAAEQWVPTAAPVYLPVSTEQEISYHDIETSNLDKFRIHVSAPSEYAVYFYNEQTHYYQETAAFEADSGTAQVLFMVKLKGERGLPAGKALDIQPGESSMRIGLGYLPNGQSAGYLDFSPVEKLGVRDVMGSILMDGTAQGGLSRDDFKLDLPGRISAPFYCFPTSGDVKLIFEAFTSLDGQENQRLKQVLTPQALVDIVRENDGTQYTVNFYDPATVSASDDEYVSSGDPFVNYVFATSWQDEDQAWNWNTSITRTEGDLVQEASFSQDSSYKSFSQTFVVDENCYDYPVEVCETYWIEITEMIIEVTTECETFWDEVSATTCIGIYTDSSTGEEYPGDMECATSTDYIPRVECTMYTETYTISYLVEETVCDSWWESYCYPIYDTEAYSVPLPRKSIQIQGFNGARTEYRASSYEELDETYFNGDSYQMARTAASTRLVGRYGAARNNSSPAYISTKEVAYQFTGSVSAPSGFLPDLVSGDYGYRTDRRYYDIDLATGDKYPGRLFWEENPDRSWTMFEYYQDPDQEKMGLVRRIIKPHGDTARPVELPADNAAGYAGYQATTFDYAADWDGAVRLPTRVENWVDGVRLSVTEHTHEAADNANGKPVWQTTTETWADAPPGQVQVQTSISKVYQGKAIDPLWRGLPYSVQAADGTKTVFAYDRGTVDAQGNFTVSSTGAAFRAISVTGLAPASGGVTSLDGTSQAIDAVNLENGLSLRMETIRDARGLVVRVNKFVYNNGAWAAIEWEKRSHDVAGNLLHVESSNGTAMDYEYTSVNGSSTNYASISFANTGTPTGRLQYSRDANGIITKYTYGDFGRVTETLQLAIPAASGMQDGIAALRTAYTYDADGRILSKTTGPDDGEQLGSAYTYNFAGQLVEKTEQGLTTTYAYDNASAEAGKITSMTETRGDGATVTVENNRDGTPKSKTGTAIVSEYYTYAVDEAGYMRVTTHYGSTDSPRWSSQWKDGLGRVTKEQKSTAAGDDYTVEYTYNNKGQLASTQPTGLAATTYIYDAFGRLSDTLAGNRHESVLTDYRQRANDTAWWKYEETHAHPDGNTTVPVKKTWTRITGHASAALPSGTALTLAGSVLSEVITQDSAGNESRGLVLVHRDTARRFSVSVNPLASCAAVELSLGGLPVKSVSSAGVTGETVYDSLHRPVRQEDRTSASAPHTGSHLTYIPGSTRPYETFNDLGHLVSRKSYDAAGRVISVEKPLVAYTAAGEPAAYSAASVTHTHYHYNIRGQLTHTWGDATQPVKNEYNVYGDLIKQHTYRAFAGVGAATGQPGGDPDDWPAASAADTTEFTRNPQDGSLAVRIDAKNKTTGYTYNVQGQVATITSPRMTTVTGTNIVTTNTYDDDTGELLSVSHSDGTPGTAYTYDNLGRVATVQDASGWRTFTYRPGDLRLASEKLGMDGDAADPLSVYGSDLVLEQAYGAMNGAASVALGVELKSGLDTHYSYYFSANATTGRLASLTTDAGVHTVAYLGNSDLVQAVANGSWGQARTFEDNRNLVASMNTVAGLDEVTRQAYQHDALGRRYHSAQTGLVYHPYLNAANAGEELVTEYAYDARSQLTASRTRTGDPANMTGAANVPGRSFAYTYDTMGNRVTETNNGTTHNYGTNELNQYTGRATAPTVPVSGMAPEDATVLINSSTLAANEFLQRYFYRDINKIPSALATPPAGGLQSVNIAASGTSGGGWSYNNTVQFFVRPTAENFAYDDDGNLTSDGLWNYTYDAKNQLMQVVSKYADQTGSRVALRFVYDYQGRRVAKRVYDANAAGGVIDTALRSERLYVYDGWLLAAEYEVDPGTQARALVRTYTWGPDLGGGDGIGGLLAIKDHRAAHAGVYQTAFDGNGNLVALVHQGTNALVAAYEYDGFGNLLRSNGEYAAENPFRFSTKYQDAETGLLYYGLRYYSASMGRFINRDPIGEEGGINLYAMAGNDLVNNTDYLGMGPDGWDIPPDWPTIYLPGITVGGESGMASGGFTDFSTGYSGTWGMLWFGDTYMGAYSLTRPDGTTSSFVGIKTPHLEYTKETVTRVEKYSIDDIPMERIVTLAEKTTFTEKFNHETNSLAEGIAETSLPEPAPAPVAPQMSVGERLLAAGSAVLNITGAVASMAAAAGTSASGVGALAFGLLAVKFIDNAYADLGSALSGRRQETVFNTELRRRGVSESTAGYISMGVDIAGGAGLIRSAMMAAGGVAAIGRQAAAAESRTASLYTDVTRASSRVANRATDVSKAAFEKNLVDSGWLRSVSKDGKAIILEKDGARYILRDGAKSTGGATADFYKAGSQSIDVKIRLGTGGSP